MEKDAKVYITGASGLVGSALINHLKQQGYTNLLTTSHHELDLLDQIKVNEFFDREKPDYVFHLAAKVGGIMGNKTFPADFTYENLQINTNVIHAAHEAKVKKLLNFGSICIYPVQAPIPVKEEYLLTGPLEYTNEGYALSKIASLMMCKKYKEQYGDNFISVMPANLYGPNDNFNPQYAHVIPMLMGRFHKAKVENSPDVVVWGTGKPTRDFLFSEDLAQGLLFVMEKYDELEHINIGPGSETSIKELAETLKTAIEFEGELNWDTSKPDGTPRRYLDTTKIQELGWKPQTTLKEGLTKMYAWYTANPDKMRT